MCGDIGESVWEEGVLWTGNSNGDDDDERASESESDRSDVYLEKDNNNDDEDDDLDENEYESSDVVSGTGRVQMIKVKNKGNIKYLKLKK